MHLTYSKTKALVVFEIYNLISPQFIEQFNINNTL